MAYYLDLFSPETHEAFSISDRTVSGFRIGQRAAADRIRPGDKLVCYLTKVSRWVGILEVESPPFIEETPIFLAKDDPFILRFKVKPIVWLPASRAVPIRENHVWEHLSLVRGQSKKGSQWTGRLRSSLVKLSDDDGQFLENLLTNQLHEHTVYEVNEQEYARLVTPKHPRRQRSVKVVIPEDILPSASVDERPDVETRESYKIQALLARIGEQMGMKVWLPRGDRGAVLKEWKGNHDSALDHLPLNYDEKTIRTIEQIDVLWLRGRSIVRAFEIEHTTAVYSGILRMADLLALQPNMDIKLHIVAPESRRDKVFQELQRPVFSLLQRGPLSSLCTFISYGKIRDLAAQKHLQHMSDTVLDDYSETA